MIFKKKKLDIEKLVHGEDDPIRAPPTIGQLYNRVRGIHYKSYFHYLYFNTVKWSYFQGMVIVPYCFSSNNCYRHNYTRFRSTDNQGIWKKEGSLNT